MSRRTGSDGRGLPEWALRGRAGWRYTGETRPPFAETPGPGQESVWDYPRPPRIAADPRTIRVVHDGTLVASTTRALRVLETASPPTFYLPENDVRMDLLTPAAGRSLCEWKGEAAYWTLRIGRAVEESLAWSYPQPVPGFEQLRGHLSFYPARIECFVDEERVAPQPGRFYGGWVTSEIVGPFKGAPGSPSWW